jgi:hypothetical protein
MAVLLGLGKAAGGLISLSVVRLMEESLREIDTQKRRIAAVLIGLTVFLFSLGFTAYHAFALESPRRPVSAPCHPVLANPDSVEKIPESVSP